MSYIYNMVGGAWYSDADVKSYCGKWPNASGSPIDITYMNNNNIKTLTGTIIVSSEKAPVEASAQLNADNTVRGYKNGEDITIYSIGGGGVAAPWSCSNMFSQSNATSIDLSSFDTSNVINMSWMFQASKAISLDLSSFNTSNVINMVGMFNQSKAKSLDLSSFDTSKVTNMSNMFQYSEVEILDLSGFNTSKVTDMSWMFQKSQATTLNLNNFDTSSVIRMDGMFWKSAATSLDLSSFDTSKVTNMENMFLSSQAKTVYCRTEADRQKFMNSSNCPSTINFIVGKPTA